MRFLGVMVGFFAMGVWLLWRLVYYILVAACLVLLAVGCALYAVARAVSVALRNDHDRQNLSKRTPHPAMRPAAGPRDWTPTE